MAVILTKRKGGGAASSIIQLFITGEKISGNKDNDNRTFTTASSYTSGSLSLYYNGQRLIRNDDYTETGAQSLKLIYVKPYSEDSLIVDYIIPVT